MPLPAAVLLALAAAMSCGVAAVLQQREASRHHSAPNGGATQSPDNRDRFAGPPSGSGRSVNRPADAPGNGSPTRIRAVEKRP